MLPICGRFGTRSRRVRNIRHKSTKNFKNFKTFGRQNAKFAYIRPILYLCSVKRIEYIMPIDYIRGNISGRQDLKYSGGDAYALPANSRVSADSYQPRMIARVMRKRTYNVKYFQVRTRTTVNMSAATRLNMALMGGTGALIGSLMSDKTSAIYQSCIALTPKEMTLRSFLSPIIRAGLTAKDPSFVVGSGVEIVNPWVSSASPNVPVTQEVLDKFASELS